MAEWLTLADLCILRPNPESRELEVASVHPGVERRTIAESTGWQIRFSDECGEMQAPTSAELEMLRELKARAAAVHGVEEAEA